MIGKRIALYVTGVVVLLLMSGLVLLMMIDSAKRELSTADLENVNSEETMSPEENPVDSAQEIQIESSGEFTGPILVATLTGGDKWLPLSTQAIDMFVVSGSGLVGKDSRRNQVEQVAGMSYQEGTSTVRNKEVFGKQIEVVELGVYSHTVEIQVVGLAADRYLLEGVFQDVHKTKHHFSYSSETKKGQVDKYVFDYQTGVIEVGTQNYLLQRPTENNDDVSGCNEIELTTKLTKLLVAGGWDIQAVPLEKTEVILANAADVGYMNLPFSYDKVCAVSMTFVERYENEVPENRVFRSITGNHEYAGEVDVGSETFGSNPADGPLSSQDVFPLTITGNELQLLGLQSNTKLIPINFPDFSICPCSYEYKATLTAPMYPGKNE